MPASAVKIHVCHLEKIALDLHDNPVPKYKTTQQLAIKYCVALFAGETPITSMGDYVETISIPTTTSPALG